ncbi:hypothetical protein L207DRAFT_565338 [Hyaloscypha variabilis F]|uniref:Uncharacterized protein n=1 Tax=Hyaloscypha variabilis (strain UAMH 11265 / GT02V1 / F) TaxID=1149755 RepID=A0A2J6RSI8_HYAVF|nr:hypothetical protein L207DRAFT_565338 [Hyaloscypha variabilis F]
MEMFEGRLERDVRQAGVGSLAHSRLRRRPVAETESQDQMSELTLIVGPIGRAIGEDDAYRQIQLKRISGPGLSRIRCWSRLLRVLGVAPLILRVFEEFGSGCFDDDTTVTNTRARAKETGGGGEVREREALVEEEEEQKRGGRAGCLCNGARSIRSCILPPVLSARLFPLSLSPLSPLGTGFHIRSQIAAPQVGRAGLRRPSGWTDPLAGWLAAGALGVRTVSTRDRARLRAL